MTYPTVATALNPSTELDAVNAMLATIGAQPVTSLPSTAPDAALAQTTLYETLLEVLSEEWYFNSYWNYLLTADGSGFLNIPATALRVMIDPSTYTSLDVVQKGLKLWDRKNQTYVWPAGTTVYVALSELMDFVDCPPDIRAYITARASHVFADRSFGAANVHQYIVEREQRARANALRCDQDRGRYTLFDNSSVRRVVSRVSPNSSGMTVSTLTLD